jgi:NADH-quinone oxidoreductase subunit I
MSSDDTAKTPPTAIASATTMSPRPRGAHGAIALDPAACTACDLCVVECPAWCIELTSHTQTKADGPGRPRKVKVLDDFAIDFGLCIYCGICVQVCPFDALAWVPVAVPAAATAAVPAAVSAAGPDRSRPLLTTREGLSRWWSHSPTSTD